VVSDDDHHSRLDSSVPFGGDRSETLPLTIVTRSHHAAIGSAKPGHPSGSPPAEAALGDRDPEPDQPAEKVPEAVLHL